MLEIFLLLRSFLSRFQSHHTSRSRFGTVVERLSRLQILEDSRKRPNIYKQQLFFSLSYIYFNICYKAFLVFIIADFLNLLSCLFFRVWLRYMYLCAFSSTYFLSLSLIFIFKSFFNRRILSKYLFFLFGGPGILQIELSCGEICFVAIFSATCRSGFFSRMRRQTSWLIKTGQEAS